MQWTVDVHHQLKNWLYVLQLNSTFWTCVGKNISKSLSDLPDSFSSSIVTASPYKMYQSSLVKNVMIASPERQSVWHQTGFTHTPHTHTMRCWPVSQNLKEGVVCSALGFSSITQERFKPIQWLFMEFQTKVKKKTLFKQLPK